MDCEIEQKIENKINLTEVGQKNCDAQSKSFKHKIWLIMSFP